MNIDWKLLATQKQWLAAQVLPPGSADACEEAEGLLNLIDAIEDYFGCPEATGCRPSRWAAGPQLMEAASDLLINLYDADQDDHDDVRALQAALDKCRLFETA